MNWQMEIFAEVQATQLWLTLKASALADQSWSYFYIQNSDFFSVKG